MTERGSVRQRLKRTEHGAPLRLRQLGDGCGALGKHLAYSWQIGHSSLMQIGVRLPKRAHDPAQAGGMANEIGQERGTADPLVDDARATFHLNHFPDLGRWGT
jgi:hypothetical protein